ncbi:MAG TPA: hypothetical protein VEB21_04140 [Terriglobales bacterium]|nr:hypothetical protein [Terriglobales bacterium]
MLDPIGVDIYGTAPAFECDTSTLGCEELDADDESYSRRQMNRRSIV